MRSVLSTVTREDPSGTGGESSVLAVNHLHPGCGKPRHPRKGGVSAPAEDCLLERNALLRRS